MMNIVHKKEAYPIYKSPFFLRLFYVNDTTKYIRCIYCIINFSFFLFYQHYPAHVERSRER